MHASVCACLTMYKYAMLNPFSVDSTQHFTADHFELNDNSGVILGEDYFSLSWQFLVFYSSSPRGGAPSDGPHPKWPANWGWYRVQVFFRPGLDGLSQVETDDLMKMATVCLR